MIFYFSGTGNTKYCAEFIASQLNDESRFMNSDSKDFTADGSYGLGFVFPIYSWGVPPIVVDFVNSLPSKFWDSIKERNIPVWCVMTCGDEVALAPEMFRNIIKSKGVDLKSIWSVIMPNNYVLLPGFDVDPKDVEAKKLKEAPQRLKDIAAGIKRGERGLDVVRGSMPWIKTKLVYPLFKRWGIFPKKWHTTDECNGCGKCAKSCPIGNVHMEPASDVGQRPDRHPVWGAKCCSCLACYHSCPRHAVEYASITRKKGQYQKK